MIYVTNSIRALEAYTASSYNEGEKYISEAFNTSYNTRSEYNVLSETSETNIIIKIKNTIISFFKWLWGKITEFGSNMKKFFVGLVNKIKGIKFNKKENNAKYQDDKTVNLVVLDFDEAKALINNFTIDYYENEDFNNVKNNYKSDIDKIIYSKDDNSIKVRNLNKLFDDINNFIKLINGVYLSDMLDIKKGYTVDEMIKILKEKYSFYEKDGSLKKKFQKSIIIKVSEEEKEEEFFKAGTLDLINQLNETIDKNAQVLTKAIKDLQDLAINITDYINIITNKIEDEKLSAELVKKSKETAETIMKTSNEANKIKNETATICMKNAAKAKSVIDEIVKSVANAKTGEDIEKIYADNKYDVYKGQYLKVFDSIMEGLDKQQLLKLIKSSGFYIEEFVCLSQWDTKYYQELDFDNINDSYQTDARIALSKIHRMILSGDKEKKRKFNLYRNVAQAEKTQDILKDYYSKIIKDFKNESKDDSKNENALEYKNSNIFSEIKFI